MASRNYASPHSLTRDLVCIVGSFAPNGSSAISASSRKGLGWSVARTSAGLFTITFSDKYADLVSGTVTMQMATGTDIVPQLGVYTAASKTITIATQAVAVATDVAANANNRVNFVFWFRNSSATPVRG